MTELSIRWSVRDKQGNLIYLTPERWEHIIDSSNHPEMTAYEDALKETIQLGKRTQDPLNPQKYRYSMAFNHLAEYNTHLIAIVIFRLHEQNGQFLPNNYIVTAFQKEIG